MVPTQLSETQRIAECVGDCDTLVTGVHYLIEDQSEGPWGKTVRVFLNGRWEPDYPGHWFKTPILAVLNPAPPVKSDNITLPNHYARFKIEPIYFIMENKLSFEVGNVVKYVCRHDAKNGIEDLKKARRYLDMMIKKAEGNEKYAGA